MRGPISATELPFVTAAPLRALLPGLLLDDALLMALCAALDDLFAPDVAALDCFGAYLDPRLAPDDFVAWLAGIVGCAPTRAAVAGAATDQAIRGTALGVRRAAAAAAGVEVERVTVLDPGGVSWSATAGGAAAAAPREAAVRVLVAVAADAATATDTDADAPAEAVAASVRAALEACRPVHVPLEIEVIAS